MVLAGLVLALAFPGAAAAAPRSDSIPTVASAAQLFPPPGAGSDVIQTSALPVCSTITPTSYEAAGLGWRSPDGVDGKGAFTVNRWAWPEPPIDARPDKVYEYAVTIPCVTVAGGTTVRIPYFMNYIQGDAGVFSKRGGVTWEIVCYSTTTGLNTTRTFTQSGTSGLQVDSSPPPADALQFFFDDATSCPYLRSITMTLAGESTDETGVTTPVSNGKSVWKPSQWKSGGTDWTPASNLAELADFGGSFSPIESVITCVVDNAGADIWATLINFIVSVAKLPACLFIPIGWDRAQLIPTTVETGPIGGMVTAYEEVIPESVGCGVLATIPTWGGSSVALDTCDVDFAPEWVKIGVCWAVVLGLYLLMVRRFLWSLGTK